METSPNRDGYHPSLLPAIRFISAIIGRVIFLLSAARARYGFPSPVERHGVWPRDGGGCRVRPLVWATPDGGDHSGEVARYHLPSSVGCAMTTSDTCPGVGIVEVGWHLRLASGPPHDPQRPDQPAKSPAPQSPQPGPQPVVTLALEAPTLLLGRDVSVTLLRIDPHPRKSSVQLAVARP